MANRRVLVKRRKATRNIRKITRTMQLIATARYQHALNRAVASRPFTQKLAELTADLARAGDGLDHPLLKTQNPHAPVAVVVVTSSRGLCGGYNSNVLRATTVTTDELRRGGAAGIELHVRAVEEPYLARAHGPSYRAYAARTARFVPGCGRL